ncbi:hypothetical protein BU26DRAFT_514591 [Trematosphaeria pertusa]|uniref:Uncharacterized protein n=1 Tax=Trematosphaeria pertusa TaxID=390896 RepID=A0A6A6IWQ6_9PLEO|nr:uncharacterized protein BU26DRAFT_514591 [Trematosphaeria pertusa]KAF2254728.1 hypothetical protein BU26DRAFT_514591 [Trematosphaeria pertusa]
MESNNGPKRVVLRFDVRHDLEEAAINERYFALFGPEPPNDFYSHLMAPNESSKMHIVLDIHCKSYPRIDNSKIPYEVFKVKKKDEFEFEKLNSIACQYARARCERIKWGTDRSQSEELDGVRALHGGDSPGTFVS